MNQPKLKIQNSPTQQAPTRFQCKLGAAHVERNTSRRFCQLAANEAEPLRMVGAANDVVAIAPISEEVGHADNWFQVSPFGRFPHRVGMQVFDRQAAMSSGTRDKFSTSQIYGGDAQGSGLLAGVRGLPETTAQEAEEKKKLLAIVGELVALEEKRAGLVQRDAEHATEQAAHAAATSKDLQDELAIAQAKSRGDEQGARYLEYQLKLRHELKSLEEAKVDQPGLTAAKDRLALEYQLSEEKIRQREADKDAHHHHRPAHEPHHRRGDRDGVPTVGYHARPGDAGFVGVGGVGESTAARLLAGMLSPFQNAPTVGQGIGPLTSRLPAPGAGSEPTSTAAGAGVAGARDDGSGELATSMRNAASAGSRAAQDSKEIVADLKELTRAFSSISERYQEMRRAVQDLQGQVRNQS